MPLSLKIETLDHLVWLMRMLCDSLGVIPLAQLAVMIHSVEALVVGLQLPLLYPASMLVYFRLKSMVPLNVLC
jgi:hypothetical protein